MELKDDCRLREKQKITVQRTRRDSELMRTLDEYERFIQWKSRKYARLYEDSKDLQQVGREAVVRVFKRIHEGELKAERDKGYYLNSVDHAMLDYARKLCRKTCFVWHYEKRSGPTRTKRYRYGGEWKARIQYHGDKLTLVGESRRSVLNLMEDQAPGRYEENFFEG